VFQWSHVDGFITKDITEIRDMISSHFHNIFSHYALMDGVVATKNSCHCLVPHKVSFNDRNMLDSDFPRKNYLLYYILCRMVNIQSWMRYLVGFKIRCGIIFVMTYVL